VWRGVLWFINAKKHFVVTVLKPVVEHQVGMREDLDTGDIEIRTDERVWWETGISVFSKLGDDDLPLLLTPPEKLAASVGSALSRH